MIEFGRCAYSEGGLIRSAGSLAEGGDYVVHLDEDALPWADLGRLHHGMLRPRRDPRQTAGTTRVVQRDTRFHHVCNAVIEQGEHIGRVIDTEPISGTEILVDPHAHASDATPTL